MPIYKVVYRVGANGLVAHRKTTLVVASDESGARDSVDNEVIRVEEVQWDGTGDDNE